MISDTTRVVLGEKPVNIKAMPLRKSARIEKKNIANKYKENEGTKVMFAFEPNKSTVEEPSKELEAEEVDRLQREKAIKRLAFKEWNSSGGGPNSEQAFTIGQNLPMIQLPTLDVYTSSVLESSDYYPRSYSPPHGTHIESDLRPILARMGGEEMVKSFDERMKRLHSRMAAGEKIPQNDPSSLPSDNWSALSEYVGKMGKFAALASDTEFCTVVNGVDLCPEDEDEYGLMHVSSSGSRTPTERDSLFNLNFTPSVWTAEDDFNQAIRSTLASLQKRPSRLFMTSLFFHGKASSSQSELVLVMADGEVVTTYRRRHFWRGVGLIEACCIYQTLRCATPYELGLSPFLLDSINPALPIQLDFGLLSRVANSYVITLPRSSRLIRLQSTPISSRVTRPFNRTTLVYRYESQLSSPAIVVKISRQENFSREQSVNARLHAIPLNPLPSHLGPSTDYFPSFDFGLSLERLTCQLDQDSLDLLAVQRGPHILPRHLEILVTSTATEGMSFWTAYEQGKTTPVDLFNTVITVIDAIEFAFHQGVMHCDISPGNILFSPGDRSAKLFDFDCAEMLGEPHEMTAGTTLTMSINRLGARIKFQSTPSESNNFSKHSPLDDVESAVYYFLYTIFSMIGGALCEKRGYLAGIETGLVTWANQWSKCKWGADESKVQEVEEEGLQATRSHIWNVDEAIVQMVMRYNGTYCNRLGVAELLKQRPTSNLGSKEITDNFLCVLRDTSSFIKREFHRLLTKFGIGLDSPLSEISLNYSRKNLWGPKGTMQELRSWIYVVAGDEGASGLLKALKGIRGWRKEAEFRDLWGTDEVRTHFSFTFDTSDDNDDDDDDEEEEGELKVAEIMKEKNDEEKEEKEVECHSFKVERKCAELRAIFTKLKASDNPFLERIWITEKDKV